MAKLGARGASVLARVESTDTQLPTQLVWRSDGVVLVRQRFSEGWGGWTRAVTQPEAGTSAQAWFMARITRGWAAVENHITDAKENEMATDLRAKLSGRTAGTVTVKHATPEAAQMAELRKLQAEHAKLTGTTVASVTAPAGAVAQPVEHTNGVKGTADLLRLATARIAELTAERDAALAQNAKLAAAMITLREQTAPATATPAPAAPKAKATATGKRFQVIIGGAITSGHTDFDGASRAASAAADAEVWKNSDGGIVLVATFKAGKRA